MPAQPPPNPGVYFVLAIITVIVLSGIAYLVLLIARWNSDRIRYVTHTVRSRPMRGQGEGRSIARFDPEPEPEPEANAALERENPDRTGAFVMNADECAAVARMIEHKTTAEKPTKASAIWAGFGVKKGASARYQRASEIYDAFFVIPPDPEPFPALAEQRNRPSVVQS